MTSLRPVDVLWPLVDLVGCNISSAGLHNTPVFMFLRNLLARCTVYKNTECALCLTHLKTNKQTHIQKENAGPFWDLPAKTSLPMKTWAHVTRLPPPDFPDFTSTTLPEVVKKTRPGPLQGEIGPYSYKPYFGVNLPWTALEYAPRGTSRVNSSLLGLSWLIDSFTWMKPGVSQLAMVGYALAAIF